jgi:hypothetical protein
LKRNGGSNGPWIDELHSIAVRYPKLVIKEVAPRLRLLGKLVISGSGIELDSFDIEIIVPVGFPLSEPSVFETGGRLKSGRHVNPDGTCCVCVYEAWLATHPDPTVLGYLEGPVTNFFLSQTYYDQTGNWPFGEESHGDLGVIEAAASLLGVKVDERTVRRYLEVLAGPQYASHLPCPCGGGEKIRDCHSGELSSLHEKIDWRVARRLLRRLPAAKGKRKQIGDGQIVARLSRRYPRRA